MATESVLDATAIFRQLDEYDWQSDEEFQGGLRAILGSVQDPDQVEHLTLRAKCFYFQRKAGTTVDFDGYKSWRAQQGPANTSSNVSSANHSNPPHPASFAEICDMINQGKPIPGIKDIPDTILEGQGSESQSSKRRKPWEKEGAADKPSWMT